jgi:chaperonin GroES
MPKVPVKLPTYNYDFANQIDPAEGQLIIVPAEIGDDKVGSLFLPDTAKGPPQVGYVVRARAESIYKSGSFVIFPRYSGVEFRIGRDSFIIIPAADILAEVYP